MSTPSKTITPATVLIVDDIAYVRKTLRHILIARGYKIVGEADSGTEAVRLYAETQPDIVTMDLAMPRMNGVEATREILRLDPEARVIVLSALLQENLVTEAILAGAKEYIVKPFQTEEVIRVIDKVVKDAHFELQANRISNTGGAA